MVKTNFKHTEIGLIPEDWEVLELKAISSLKGRIGWQGLKQEEFSYNDSEPFLITGMNFKDGKIRWNEVYHVPFDRYDIAKDIQLKIGDVLMTKDGTIGKVLFVDYIPSPFKATLNSHLLLYRPRNNSYEPRYLYYNLQSDYFNKHIEENKSGSTFFGISQASVGKYKIALPTLVEQQAIATALSDADAWIESLEKLIAKKRLIKQGAMQELLTPKEDWEVKKLGDLTKVFTKQTGFDYSAYIKPSLVQSKTDQVIPFIQNKDFNNKWINLDTDYYIPTQIAKNFPRILLDEKSLLISISGAIGNVGVYEKKQLAFIGGAVAILKFKDIRLIDWVMYYLKSDQGQNKLYGNVKAGSHQNLILDDLRKIEIPFPLVDEQIRIANILSDMDAEIVALEQKLQKTQQVKGGMMQQLLTGKIRLVKTTATKGKEAVAAN